MHIFVRTLTKLTYNIEIEPDATIADLKQKIQGEADISADLQICLHGGKVFEHDKTLAECSIRPNCNVHLALRIRGGTKTFK